MQSPKIRVLLADDDQIGGKLLCHNLDADDLEIIPVHRSNDVFSSIERYQADIVLLDLLMPGISGMEILQQIRETYNLLQLPVIVITGQVNAVSAVNALRLGANDYILKPLNGELLRARIDLQLKLKALLNASEVGQERFEFLANVSHELRTTMHGILSYARFGQKKVAEASRDKMLFYFSRITESATRLMALLDDLLDLSKMEAGKMNVQIQTYDLMQVIDMVHSEFMMILEEKEISFQINSPDFDTTVEIDPIRIGQVLRNLLSNAVKFSPQGSRIHMALENVPQGVLVKVIDQGPGLDASESELIFEKYIQGANMPEHGTGLGLAIAKCIVEQHGGNIWVESNLSGGGSTFAFFLPRPSGELAA